MSGSTQQYILLALMLMLFGSRTVRALLMRLWKEEEGQDLTEYGLLLVLVALAAIGSMGVLANAINNAFSSASTNLSVTTS